MRQNPNEKIIRMWTAAAVLTVELIFLFIASRRMNSLSRNILLSNRNGRDK